MKISEERLKKVVDFCNYLEDKFKKYGDPKKNEKLYKKLFPNIPKEGMIDFYDSYKGSNLFTNICFKTNLIPTITVEDNNDIEKLIFEIKNNPNYDSSECIKIENIIYDFEHLKLIDEAFPDKLILLAWHNELTDLESALTVEYMIDYYKSVIDENLSPLEKVTMAYDIVKSHYYNDYEKANSTKSRYLTQIASSNYIVCTGFVKIFNSIISKLGIENFRMSVELSIENGKTISHVRSLVNINDPKYNVSGLYIFDPTLDSAGKVAYCKFNEDESAEMNKEPIEGYKKADTLSLYKHFMIDTKFYKERYTNEKIENIVTIIKNKKNKLDRETIKEVFETDQVSAKVIANGKKRYNDLSTVDFIKLLYRVKLAEGYSKEEIPKIIRESLFISNMGLYKLKSIEKVISNMEKEKEEVIKK